MPPPVPPTEQVRPGLWSIGVPFPNNPLGYTLVYLLETDRGPVLVDAGWDDDESWDALVAGFREAGSDITDCHGVLVTHFHPDHHGLSGRVREASDAWVAMHPRDADTVERMTAAAHRNSTGGARDFADELQALLLDAGATHDELSTAPPSAGGHRGERPRPLVAPDVLLDDGQPAGVPGRDVTAVWTPGHTPGHLCFHLPGERLLLSGDHVLPSITPHISISRSDRGGDPLGDFLDSLEKVAGLDAAEVLPAHRHRFTDLAARAHAIRDHHLDHLTDIEAILADGPASLWQIAARLTWNRPWDQFSLVLRRSAVNETAAHLRYLTRRGRAVRFKGVRPFTFGLPEHTFVPG